MSEKTLSSRVVGLTAVMALISLITLLVGLVGATSATAQSAADDPAQVEAGMAVYEGNCAGCHGIDGEGSDRGRPLTGIAMQEADRGVHFTSVADGKGNMPPFGDRLSAEEIDQAISYLRLTFVPAEEAEATTTESADDAAEESAAEESASDELPVTGSSSYLYALAGLTLLLGGALFVQSSRRVRA